MRDQPPSEWVRFQRPTFPPATAIEQYFLLARESRRFSNDGPCLRLLAGRLSERTGASCLPVASGTLGLMVAAAVMRRRDRGDEAVVPSFTFPATAQAVLWNRLKPLFVDIDPDHWHMSPEALQQVLATRSNSVALVVACSSFGTPPPSQVRRAWEESCREVGVPLLVDSAAGFGARGDDGVPVGAQGDAEVVSFHATKPLAIGEGGAVFSRDSSLIERVARVANFGFDQQRRPQDPMGLNAKLDELHAATALAALDQLDDALAARRERARTLLSLAGPAFRPQRNHDLGTFQFVPVLAESAAARSRVLGKARSSVEIRTYYEPLHQAPAFSSLRAAGPLTVTEDVGRRILSLPMATDMSAEELARVAQVLSVIDDQR